METVTSLSTLNADHLLKHFNIASEEKALTGSFRFIFDRALKEADSYLPAQKKHKQALDTCIQDTAFRYRVFKDYLPGFFMPDYPMDLDLLGIALVCDRNVYRAEDLLDEDEERFFHLQPDVKELVLMRACTIFEEACNLLANGRSEIPEMKESVFLAHIHALELLKDSEEHFDVEDSTTLEEVLKDIQIWESIPEENTFLGLELEEKLKEMENKIVAYFKGRTPVDTIQTKKSHLKLVSSQPAPSL